MSICVIDCMRKSVFGKQLNRSRKSREALFRSLTRSLTFEGAIVTTKAKAKAVQGSIDKLITIAKKDDIASRRRLYSAMANDRKATDALVELAKTRLTQRISGYTRFVALPLRRGDSAETVRIEWVLDKVAKKKEESEKKVEKAKKTKKSE